MGNQWNSLEVFRVWLDEPGSASGENNSSRSLGDFACTRARVTASPPLTPSNECRLTTFHNHSGQFLASPHWLKKCAQHFFFGILPILSWELLSSSTCYPLLKSLTTVIACAEAKFGTITCVFRLSSGVTFNPGRTGLTECWDLEHQTNTDTSTQKGPEWLQRKRWKNLFVNRFMVSAWVILSQPWFGEALTTNFHQGRLCWLHRAHPHRLTPSPGRCMPACYQCKLSLARCLAGSLDASIYAPCAYAQTFAHVMYYIFFKKCAQ